MKNILFAALVFVGALFACKNSPTNNTSTTENNSATNPDIDTIYRAPAENSANISADDVSGAANKAQDNMKLVVALMKQIDALPDAVKQKNLTELQQMQQSLEAVSGKQATSLHEMQNNATAGESQGSLASTNAFNKFLQETQARLNELAKQ